jgi:Integrase core domain
MAAIPIADIKATTCAAALIREWVAHYGVPDAIMSDRGKQFVSEVWSTTCQRMGIEVKLIIPRQMVAYSYSIGS